MALTLTFKQPYLSITTFPATRLPPFTLITGLNGSGKTHLLQAIENGAIHVDGGSKDAKYFDWTSLTPGGQQPFNTAQLHAERVDFSAKFQDSFSKEKAQLVRAVQAAKLPADLLDDPDSLAHISLDSLTGSFDGDHAKAQAALKAIQTALKNVSVGMKRLLEKHKLFSAIVEIERRSGKPLAAWNPDVLLDELIWGHTDLFSQHFSRLFGVYRDIYLKNKLLRVAQNEGDLNVQPLSDDAFVKTYNIPPWDFLNMILREAGLDFVVDRPYLYDYNPYGLVLRKNSTGAEIDVRHLSSGEKILMSFTNCLYAARDNRQISTFPKVLLLDEVDAPLHPSMARGLIRIITESLVGEFGISVIAATHSASTVAMAPEEAVHVMQADVPGIHKVTRNAALAVLTAGVPTLSINIDGRRQVFVESGIDARVYEAVYQLSKQFLKSERSLTFLAPGSRAKEGDLDNGCDAVKRIVDSLEKLGNRSVLGLIDWDGKNDPSDRVKVVAWGKRDGVENCLLDPLLLGCMIARDAKDFRIELGLPQSEGSYYMKRLNSIQLQELVDAVQKLIFKDKDFENEANVRSLYAGGMELMVKSFFVSMDDHKLESRIFDAVPPLRQYRQRAGQLIMHVAEDILPDFPEYIPADVLDTFVDLLSVDL